MMESTSHRAIAIVGAGAILPDAPNVPAFWENIKNGRYSIGEVKPDRWDPALYFDSDHNAPDKTYSKIGGWVSDYVWDPLKWRLAIPPRVADAMDGTQKWAIACTRQALEDYGYPNRPLNTDRTAVILGNAMGGERHYFTVMRVYFPEYAREQLKAPVSPRCRPKCAAASLVVALRISMPHHRRHHTRQLANCVMAASRISLTSTSRTRDAACASAMAAISSLPRADPERL
jgi:acyl transferase domain-containing protein